MKLYRIAIVLVISLFPLFATAQRGTVYGEVRDFTTNLGIESVNVCLLQTTDSSMVAGTQTEKKIVSNVSDDYFHAPFELKDIPEGNYILRCSFVGYETLYRNVSVKFSSRSSYVDLGKIILYPATKMLGEVSVNATKIKMVFKGDTIVYNADAFQLPEGSMLDDLVRQLPGTELRDDGKIYVNGKYVESLLINGKDFFAGDPQAALKNLPAFAVSKIKVYNKAGELSKTMGTDMGDKQFVMDVQLKHDYGSMWVSNADLGAGTDGRYMARYFGFRMNNLKGLALYGNLNNINDERTPGGNVGEWTPENRADGLMTTKLVGVAYVIGSPNEKYNLNLGANYTHKKANNEVNEANETFLTGGNTFRRSLNAALNRSSQFRGNARMWVRPKENQYYNASYSASYTDTKSQGNSWLANYSANPSSYINANVLDSTFSSNASAVLRSITTNRLRTATSANGNQFDSNLNFESQLAFSPDALTIGGKFNYQKQNSKQFSHYRLDYPADPSAAVDYRNQYLNTPRRIYDFEIKGGYYYVYKNNDSINGYILPLYSYWQGYKSNEHPLYRLDGLPGWGDGTTYPLGALPSTTDSLQMSIDAANSYRSTQYRQQHIFGLKFYHDFRLRNRGWLELRAEPLFTALNNRLNYHRNGIYYPVRRKTFFFEPNFSVWWRPMADDKEAQKMEVFFKYSLTGYQPELTYLLNIRDDSDPLNISVGNPALANGHIHYLTLRMNRKWEKYVQMLHTEFNYSITQDAVAMGFVYDKATGVRTTMPDNLNGNYMLSFDVNYSRALDKSQRFMFSTATNAKYNNSVDMIDVSGATASTRSTVHNYTFSETLKLDYKMNKDIKFGAKFGSNFTHATSRRTDFTTINAGSFHYGATAQIELPWAMQFSTDLTEYSRRGYTDAALNTNEFVWNARLSKRILKGALTFMIDGFDILGNLSNVRRTLNAQGRTETYYNVIPRYAMFHLIWKMNTPLKRKNQTKQKE